MSIHPGRIVSIGRIRPGRFVSPIGSGGRHATELWARSSGGVPAPSSTSVNDSRRLKAARFGPVASRQHHLAGSAFAATKAYKSDADMICSCSPGEDSRQGTLPVPPGYAAVQHRLPWAGLSWQSKDRPDELSFLSRTTHRRVNTVGRSGRRKAAPRGCRRRHPGGLSGGRPCEPSPGQEGRAR